MVFFFFPFFLFLFLKREHTLERALKIFREFMRLLASRWFRNDIDISGDSIYRDIGETSGEMRINVSFGESSRRCSTIRDERISNVIAWTRYENTVKLLSRRF